VERIDFTYTSPEHSPGFLLWQLHMVWQRKLNQVLTPLNLTHAQFILLTSLGQYSNESTKISQSDLASLCQIDVMTTSKSIRLLASKNLVIRTNSENDGRAFILDLTPSGKLLLEKAKSAVEKSDSEFFSSLGKEKKLLKLMKLHTKLLTTHGMQIESTEDNQKKTIAKKDKSSK